MNDQKHERPLSRRRFFQATGAAGLGAFSLSSLLAKPRAASPAGIVLPDGIPAEAAAVLGTMCVRIPALTEGPFYVSSRLNRRDVTEGLPGLPMDLYTLVVDVNNSCAPIPGALVDIWHCDADRGWYSGFNQGGGQTWLRGVQATDVNGLTYFETLFPGWYPGRTTHIHAKVHLANRTAVTTQFYFEDSLPDLVYTLVPPYTVHGRRNTTNARDPVGVPQDCIMVVHVHPFKPLTLIAGLIVGVA